jgi:hypothetical protein
MTETNTITSDTVIIRAPGGAEIMWRTQRMISLGDDAELAASIAYSDADVHDIEHLLETGCPLGLAWTIVQPVHEPRTVVDIRQEPAPGDEPGSP